EALHIVTDVQSADYYVASFVLTQNCQGIDDRHVLGEMVRSVIQNAAHGGIGAAHNPFHAVNGAQVVALINSFRAAGADEDILVVVGHADDFVRHYLAKREDEIEPAFHQ